MKLYSYWRSTTSYRVRIALHYKGLHFNQQAVDLVAGEQRQKTYLDINPVAGVPSFELEDGQVITQSMAILEYLENWQPALIPEDAIQAASVRAASNLIACDIHPINNLKVINKLKSMDHSQVEAIEWMNHWMANGLEAFQQLIKPSGKYCFGDEITLADVCLVPQLYNAHRWGTDLSGLQRLTDIETRCLELSAFQAALPENQPDAKGQI